MIEFIKVTKTFATGHTALDEVSFSIQDQEFVILTGKSGAGKTTIMRLLIHDLPVSSGSILIDGKDITKMKSSEVSALRKKIAVVFQDGKLLTDRTVAENIALPMMIEGKSRQEIDRKVSDLLELVGLKDREQFFPVQLSGGEQQRVAIARALAVAPSLIFADEPTGNLDPDSAKQIVKLFEQIRELGVSVLMATHHLDQVMGKTKRMLVLSEGKIVEREEHEKQSEHEKHEKDTEKDDDDDDDKNKEEEHEKHRRTRKKEEKEERD